MPKIKRIGIEGFRRLESVDVEMRPVMVMIGANGVGKTSFMDALSLLAASARGLLNQRLNDMGGIGDVTPFGKTEGVTLRAVVETPNGQPLEYSLELAPQGRGYAIAEECLTQDITAYEGPVKHIESKGGAVRYCEPDKGRHVVPEWEYDPLESALSQAPGTFRRIEELRRTLSSMTRHCALDTGRFAPARLPQPLLPAARPGGNGETLAPFLHHLRESDPWRFEDVEATLRVAFRGFESLSFPVAADGTISLAWKDKAHRDPIYLRQLSDGMLRFLRLVSLLNDPDLPAVTMIDDFEAGLHPEHALLLAEQMRESADRTCLIVATHSDRLMSYLELSEVLVMDALEGGGVSMTWADTLGAEDWLEDYSLDEVWRMGQIGGRS